MTFRLDPFVVRSDISAFRFPAMSTPPSDPPRPAAVRPETGELSELLDLAGDLIFSVERSGRIRFINRTACKTLGWTQRDNFSLNLFEIVLPQDHARIAQLLAPSELDVAPRNTELQLRTFDGQPLSIEGFFRPLHSPGTAPVLLGVFVNLTARRLNQAVQQRQSLAEQQIIQNVAREKELVELKAHFISMVSHELRTPLAALSLGVDFLAKYWKKLNPDKIAKSLKTIDGTVRQLRSVLDDVLVISRDQESRLRCNRVPVDLAEFCQKIAEEAEAADQNHHRILVKSRTASAAVALDPQLLSHILMNLLGNACKYSPAMPSVDLEFGCTEGVAVFTIIDRGIGIPLNDHERLFSQFFRGSNVGTIGGTGLGLAVVRRCVEAHDGAITFESSPETGSRFTVTLPTAAPT